MVDVAKVRVVVRDLALRAMVDRMENMLIVPRYNFLTIIRQLSGYILLSMHDLDHDITDPEIHFVWDAPR